MLIVMSSLASTEQVAHVVAVIREMGLTPHSLPGATRTAIGITGNISAIDPEGLACLPGVKELLRVTKPYKLASREMHLDDSLVHLPMATIGGKELSIIAGPCSVESEDLVLRTAEYLISRGVKLLRAGAFKPRTSPYAFQGMEHEGLRILEKAREKTGIGIVTEVMESSHADAVEQAADILQVGARNMQNFSLLKRLGRAMKPVLLKRGMSATLEEWLMAAEYVLAGGNKQVVLCERGVRTFADHTRNTLDLSIVPCVKEVSHLPVLVDPSHGTGKRKYVPPMALAALAAGAHGLMIEVHPDPDRALSDGAQTLSFTQFDALLEDVRRLSEVFDRQA
jgi:3-deoxy-7-phosphoheptulonate synthase